MALKSTAGISLPAIKTHRVHASVERLYQRPKVAEVERSDKSPYWVNGGTLLSARAAVALPAASKSGARKNKKEDETQARQNVLQLDEWRPVNNSLQQRKLPSSSAKPRERHLQGWFRQV